MDLTTFLARHRTTLEASSLYEARFAVEVLGRIPNLDFALVTPQHAFRCSTGRRRYIDFAITDGRTFGVAVEVDGYDKTGRGAGMTRDEHTDWARRHTSLVAAGWSVMHFANRQFITDAAQCARELESALRHAGWRPTSERAHPVTTTLAPQWRTAARSPTPPTTRTMEQRWHVSHAPAMAVDTQRVDEPTSSRPSRPAEPRATPRGKSVFWLACATGMALAAGAVAFDGSAHSPYSSSSVETPRRRAAIRTPTVQEIAPGRCGRRAVRWSDAAARPGERWIVAGVLLSAVHRPDVRGQPTFLQLGDASGALPVVLWGSDRNPSDAAWLVRLHGQPVCADLEVDVFRGRPQGTLRSVQRLRPMGDATAHLADVATFDAPGETPENLSVYHEEPATAPPTPAPDTTWPP